MLLYTTPRWLQFIFPSITWKVKTDEKVVYLTFDDGPHPEITPWVLNELEKVNAKATFFCVGENVLRYPQAYQQVLAHGHVTGNHTFNHLNGWKVRGKYYLANIEQCAQVVSSNLFRPPYGRFTLSKLKHIKRDYRIIMWDILSGDYDKDLEVDHSIQMIKRYIRNGSIIVFHDSVKAEKNLKAILPDIVDHLKSRGYSMKHL